MILFVNVIFVYIIGLGVDEEEDLNANAQLGDNYSPKTIEAMSKMSEKDVSDILFSYDQFIMIFNIIL